MKMKLKITAMLTAVCVVFCTMFVATPEKVEAAPGSISVLCIGNSITKHPQIPDFWWGDWGMAATTVNTDYVHLLQAYLTQRYSSVSVTPVSLVNWEKSAGQRENFVGVLDPYLASQPDVVTIELGENCANLGNFLFDYVYLINYIKWKDPGAKIVLVGTITTTWCDPSVEYYKQYAYHICKYAGYDIEYVDTAAVMNNPAGLSYIGELVAGWDFQWHAINNISVALHPNDYVMDFIARGIYQKI